MGCLSCRGGDMVEGFEAYFAKLKSGGYLIIENVPCFVCDQCGEVVYSTAVIAKIEKIIEFCEKLHSKISIIDYNKAAA